MLITEKTTKQEMDEVYKTYPDSIPEGYQSFHESRVMPIYWDIPEGSSVLDIGTNSGEFLKRLIEGKKGIRAKGIDMSEVAVKAARDKGLDVIQGDGENLPFDNESFDYVVLMEVLVHVFDPKKLLSEIKRVLKKDGVLIGSTPLKELEMNIWAEKRLHHAYYTSSEVYDLLKEYFYDVHFKILKGAQMNVAWAGSYIGDKDVEVLFKCGSENMKPWDYALDDKETLRVWMGPTQNAAVTKIRMTDYADKMNKFEKCDVLYDRFSFDDSSHPGKWQDAFRRSEGNKPANMVVVNQLEGLLKISDLTIWGIASSFSTLAFFNALKHVHPNKPLITEIDDWFFDVPATNIASNPYRPNSEAERIAYEQLELSDAVICSTRNISEGIKSFFPNKKVYVIPNSIDFDVWDNSKPFPLVEKKEGIVRIGYTGSGNHGADLERVKEPILAILDEFPNVEFVSAGDMRDGTFIKHDRSFFTNNWVSIDKWPASVKGWQMDIGIAPLVDSNFNRAKSNLRFLEYGALSLPTVASKVAPFECIRDGIDGFLCRGQESWYNTLKELIKNPQKRSRMGVEAYRTVKKNFSMGKIAEVYKSVLDEIKRGQK